ncbi:hypothetical protein [Streptomyces sp. NPDC048623]|uniref:hypothetical protein n=1 Tax=Streptomyces sp. NPDC048623 TaxID=3155761 RepID=UPI00342D4E5E
MEQTTKPKRAPRKVDPLVRVVEQEVRPEIPNYAAKTSTPKKRMTAHEGRAAAWGGEFEKTGSLDSLLLSLTFEVGAATGLAIRPALVQLAAAALGEIERIDKAGR